ncbi:MAG: phage BR0599 family protein [Synergistaceae bacterium]|jgi:lambda family phage minor tail protein L|nr:phage BR0599 family protein [Synergistaceae bacterium]
MLNLSEIAKFEKNRIFSDTAWIMLLEISIKPGIVLRLCSDSEDIVWNGETWVAFPFDMDSPVQNSDGELPRFAVRVSNVTRTVEGYLEQSGGGVGATVRMMVVMSSHLDETTPVADEEFTVYSTSYDQDWVTFTLSGAVNLLRRIPARRFLKNFCPFQYKGPECMAVSDLTTCDKSLKACRARGNARRFGGEPGIPMGGLYDARR